MNFFSEKTADGGVIATTLAGYDITADRTKLGLYIVTVLVLAAVYLLSQWLVNSRLGRVLVAVRDKESRLENFSGYQPAHFKVFIFTLSAIIAGIGGMLYTPQTGIITPFNMDPEKSIVMVVWVAVGGRASLSGAILGAVVINYAYSVLTNGTIYKWLSSTGAYHWLSDTSCYQWIFPHGQAVNDATGLVWLAKSCVAKTGRDSRTALRAQRLAVRARCHVHLRRALFPGWFDRILAAHDVSARISAAPETPQLEAPPQAAREGAQA